MEETPLCFSTMKYKNSFFFNCVHGKILEREKCEQGAERMFLVKFKVFSIEGCTRDVTRQKLW